MDITKEYLDEQIAKCTAEKENAINHINAMNGAIFAYQESKKHLLAEEEKPKLEKSKIKEVK